MLLGCHHHPDPAFFLQMWGAFNFRIRVDFLRVVPDPKARLAGASQALLEASCTSVDYNDLGCCCGHGPCTTSACPSSCDHTECCLQTNRVLVDLFEHIVSCVLPFSAASSLALLSLLLPSPQSPFWALQSVWWTPFPWLGLDQASRRPLVELWRSSRKPLVYASIDK